MEACFGDAEQMQENHKYKQAVVSAEEHSLYAALCKSLSISIVPAILANTHFIHFPYNASDRCALHSRHYIRVL